MFGTNFTWGVGGICILNSVLTTANRFFKIVTSRAKKSNSTSPNRRIIIPAYTPAVGSARDRLMSSSPPLKGLKVIGIFQYFPNIILELAGLAPGPFAGYSSS